MRILIDTNIVLDLILEREPFIDNALRIFEQIERGNLKGYIAATTITNIFYIIRKSKGRGVALDAINRIMLSLQLCKVDHDTIELALSLNLRDFEDSVQLACATLNRLEGIVTRDLKDFALSDLPIYAPIELLNRLQ